MATSERGMKQADVDELLTKIKRASERIFAAVHVPDDGISLEQLKQKMVWQAPLFDWALGYLVGLGDIEVSGSQGNVRVRRKWSHYPFIAKHEE